MSIYNMNNYVPTVLLSLTNNCANLTDQGVSNCIRNIFNANRLELMKILDFILYKTYVGYISKSTL